MIGSSHSVSRECPKCGYCSILTEEKIDVGWISGREGRAVRLCQNFECCTAWMFLRNKKVLLGSYPRRQSEIGRLLGVKVA
jgi:Zn-finger protein